MTCKIKMKKKKGSHFKSTNFQVVKYHISRIRYFGEKKQSNTVRQTVYCKQSTTLTLVYVEKQLIIDFKIIVKSKLSPVLEDFYGSIRTRERESYCLWHQ